MPNHRPHTPRPTPARRRRGARRAGCASRSTQRRAATSRRRPPRPPRRNSATPSTHRRRPPPSAPPRRPRTPVRPSRPRRSRFTLRHRLCSGAGHGTDSARGPLRPLIRRWRIPQSGRTSGRFGRMFFFCRQHDAECWAASVDARLMASGVDPTMKACPARPHRPRRRVTARSTA